MSFFKGGRDSKTGQFQPVGPRGAAGSDTGRDSEKSRSPMFQTFTLPDGKKIQHMRKDAFDRAIDSAKKG
ncbi:hypothetical protein RvVAT039_pl12120 (plasmid) [Agrobacterium vitis]|uniref:Uncharacterized protein n=1 Tax=Agrobacterium rosae TaxID=1972867 RepID=A0ABU4W502_9HYPH|nr:MULTISPECIES: hypothetical protein [Rhizobium/Agrobacterium group]NTF22741.1 hypothetical protein [Agrobacterium rubi]MDX8316004.1 hypothetical protein [Agrobacterium rosae]MDX8332056.1 hypothetical protein [Agrobacterium rosae]NSY51439.1 hypothetical protein [Agrobacterium tumefaciens]NTF29598.1 hypothetical protein [Agrobacterium rubi]